MNNQLKPHFTIHSMQKTLAPLSVLLLLLSGCNLPVGQTFSSTPTADLVATQVAELLTAQPSPTVPTAGESATIAPTATFPPTPTATPEPSATVAANPTPTTNPSDPALTLGDPSWQDNLDNTKNFYLYENDNTKIEADTGVLALTGRNANDWLGWSLTYSQQPSNFYLESTFRTRDCSGADLYGTVFRANKDNAGYFFGVTCDGQYNLYERDFNNNTDSELIPLTSAGAILTGSNQTNRLGVMAQGDKLSFYLNGVLVADITSSTYSQGYFGAFVAASQTAGFRVDLDQVRLWKL